MDEFLRDIHTLLFKEWILIQSIEGCDIKEENKINSFGEIITNKDDNRKISLHHFRRIINFFAEKYD